MKTLSSTVLRILLIIAAVFSFSKANAHDFEVDGIYYNFDYEYENGVMVTYRGSSGYDYSNRYVGNVVIPTTVNYNGTTYSVKSIGRDAFYNCSRLTNVTIPNSVMSIGGRAFYGCRGLINITIPNSVTTIDYLAFSGCTGLKGVYITDLAAWCNISFDYSDSNPLSCAHRLYVNGYEVIELNIPNNVTAIGNYAFYGCSGLASINIPNSITTIGDHAFYGCTALTSVSIPSSVTTIGYAAFSNCSMDILNFNAVDCAGFDQSNLNIFYDSNILTINFGDSVHKIPDCFGLGIKGVTNVSIGNSVIDIGKLAFYRFSQLKTIIIPNSVKSIGNSAFCDCSGMTSISIPNSVTSIGGWAFGNCTGLTSINIPNTITSIEEYTFKGCSGLTSINIPSSVTAIGNYAFKDCSRLSNIDIPNSVTSIGYDAFSSTAWYNSQPDGLIYAGLIAYSYKGTMPSGTNIILRDGTLGISGYAFKDCQGLISIDIPNSITNIGKSAFYGCSGLTSIDIPNLVTTIDSYAFSGCNGLTSIDIPNSVTNIGNSAFYGCSGLTSVNIPNSVTIIGSSAFESCSSLTDVHSSIADPSVISMGDNVFFLNNEDYSNRKLHVPLGSIPAYLVDQKWRIYFATVEDGDTVVTLKLKGELLIAEGGNEVHCNDTSISYDQLWISYTGDEDVEFTILYDDYFDVMPGGGGGQKRDGERNSYYLLNGDYVSEYVSWDDQNKRYIVDLYSLVYDDVFDDFDSEYLNYYNIYCCFSFIITVHADGYNDLSKEYSGHSSHYPEVEGGDSPPEISDPICSNLTAFINVYYEWSVNGSYVSSPYNYEQLDFGDDEFEHPDVYAFERRDEDYYVTVSAYQHSAPSGMYWGDSSRTLLIPARECSISISRFLDNEPLSTFYFCDGEEYGMIISPDFDVIGEKESLAVAEFSQWLQPFGYIYDYDYNWNFDCQISIDGQTVSNYFSDYSDILDISYCVVDLLPYGNAFGGNHQIKVTATDGYNSLSVDTVLSYHPIDTILTPYSLVIDVNSGKGGCLLIVDDEEVELSNDGPGTPAHIYALPRKDHDYSITVQVGNFIATSDYGEKVDELYVCYQGRCQETTIVVPAKEFFDFEEDGVYYSITSENKVIVTRSEEAYQGVVIVPSTVTYDGVTYTVTGIGYDAFADADLTNLVLPVTISSIDSTAFTNCHIHSLVITGDGTWTGGAISCDVDNLYVMGTVTGIKGLQVNPTTVYSYPTVPPTCDEQSFTGYDGELHVPASALAAYFTAPYWCNFINIVGDAIEPTGLTVNRDSVEVLVGNQLRLTATAVPANATPNEIFWTSNDESIATVTDGIITALKTGECNITAYLLDKSATCHVIVTEIAPTEVILNQEYAKLEIGSQLTLTATVMPEDATDKYVTWSTTNSDVATVDSLGVVTAVGQGECFITASCRDNQAMCHIIVVDHFVFITLDEHEVRLLPNHMFTLTPTVSPANTNLVVTSSDPTVAAARMANGNIQVVGIAEGTTVVTVNSTDGYAEVDSCLVKVYTLRGDVNKDGFVNISDVTALINYLLSGDAEGIDIINADTDNNGKINIGDVTRLINHLLSGDELDPKEEPIEGAETFTVNGVSFTMVAVEGGTFTMGATPEQGDDAFDAEKPAHQVTLSDYAIGQTEVTQALWVAVMGTNPSRFKDRPENPVEGVTWIDCQTFIAQLNQLTGKQFRLPTEAEWEYAARGGNQSQGYKYAGSNDIDEVAWYDENSSSTQPVGTKKANELNLYDMSGNVWEWCQDYYGDYSAEPQTNPTGPATGTDRIRRGVGWNGSQINGRVSHRSSRAETYKYNSLGLRLAL